MNSPSNLKYLIEPTSIAVVGASERPYSLGATTLDNLISTGYSGQLYPINPKYEEIANIPCYSGWADVPSGVECAIICTPAHTVPGLLNEAGEAGVRAAIVFASGFAETGEDGSQLQAELKEVANNWGMVVCGPNCLGLVTFTNRFTGYSAPMTMDESVGRISAVCQSGSVALALLNSGRGLQYRTVVSSGNEAVLTIEDYLEFLVEDDGTDTIMAFVEGFRNIPKLRTVAARALEKGKPIIVLKIGRSSAGRDAAIAHTGALAGSDQVLDALMKQLGIVRVLDLDELLETTTLFQKARRPIGQRVGVIGISGGEVGLLADLAEDSSLELAELSKTTIDELKGLLPPFSNVSNPLDAWGLGDLGDTYASCLRSMANDPGVDLVAISQDSHAGLGPEQAGYYSYQARSVVQVYEATDKPIVLFSNVSGGIHPDLRSILDDGNVPTLQGTRESLRAIQRLVDFSRLQAEPPEYPETTAETREPAVEPFLTEGSLSEHTSTQVLAAYGIPVTQQELVSSPEEAVKAASRIGYPVVLKVDSPDIQHKTDVGAVRLGIPDEHALTSAYDELLANAQRAQPDAQVNGILVQEMLDLTNSVEVIVGITHDPQSGPALLFGMGGILVEVLKDVAIRVAPLTEEDAWSMLEEIRSSKILDGARGQPAVDKQAIVDVLLKMSAMAMDLGDRIAEVDVNPLIVFPEGRGAVAADALIVTA